MTDPCAIKMYTNTLGTIEHYEKYNSWRVGDTRLDWGGAQDGQGNYQGMLAQGTPLVWTTNNVLSPGFQELNTLVAVVVVFLEVTVELVVVVVRNYKINLKEGVLVSLGQNALRDTTYELMDEGRRGGVDSKPELLPFSGEIL